MFQLFKDRTFSDYINDTFQFFKILGRHFFQLYFIINGGLLLLVTVMIYFLTKIYFDFLFSRFNAGLGPQQDEIGGYFTANLGLIIVLGIVALLIFIIASMLQFTFPVVYLDLYDSKKGTGFTTKDVLNAMKKRIPKILKFVIGSIFIIMPLFIILGGLMIALCFIIIGIPLLFIMVPAIMSFYHLVFFYYMNSEESFFSAIGDGFETVKGQFWPIVGSTVIMMIIIQVVNTIFTTIPYLMGMANMMTSIETGNLQDRFSSMAIMMSIIMVASIIVGYILNNLILINQGMIYYSHIENSESNISNDLIDQIGIDAE